MNFIALDHKAIQLKASARTLSISLPEQAKFAFRLLLKTSLNNIQHMQDARAGEELKKPLTSKESSLCGHTYFEND